MKTKTLTALAALTAAMLGPVWAQTPPPQGASPEPTRGEMVDRFYKGRMVVDAAAKAAGGAAALRGLTAIAWSVEGQVSNDIQGYSAARIGNPGKDGKIRIVNRFDFAGQRFYQRIQQSFNGDFDSAFATIWKQGVQYAPRWATKDFSKTENAPSPFGPGGPVMVASRWTPPVILQRALQNFRSIAWVGEAQLADGAADIVEFSFDEQTRFRIFVARADQKIRRVEAIAPDPVAADDVSVAEFSGDQTVSGIVFPLKIRAMRRGFAVQDLALKSVAVNPAFADSDFATPEGFTQIATDPQIKTTQISGRVYEVSGLAGGTYQTPFVVMDDFVVAYEAPLGIGPSRQIIAEIKKVAGDKPIRYVVVSHFHADHAGGVGAFVEAGATVVSSAKNKAILQTYASANRPQFQGMEGPRAGLTMQFLEAPESGLEIADRAGSRLRVVDFPGNGHVENMLAVVDPVAGVFMGADHYIEAVFWNPTFERTAEWIKKESGVATVLGTHHRPLARDTFLSAAKKRRDEFKPGKDKFSTLKD